MGIFGGGYMKEGKGVDKNEPKKKGFFLFIDVLTHKISKIIGTNCLYTMTSIIWIVILYMFFGLLIGNTGIVASIAETISEADASISAEEMQGSIILLLQLVCAMGIFSMWGSGPASAAYAYIHRCFTRGEHAWVLSDGKDKIRENFKQGMLVVLFDAIMLIFAINAGYFYYTLYIGTANFIWLALSYIIVLVFLIYTMMHPYIYQIMVTFECGIWSIYKNALIMTLAKLPVNFLLLVLSGAVIYAMFTFVNPLAASLIILIAGLCLTSFPSHFYAARVIERTILKDIKEKQPKIEYIGEDE